MLFEGKVALSPPAKNGIFEQFMYKYDHFAKTGSGQTWGKRNKRWPVTHRATSQAGCCPSR
jgi:hypothetical protein